jgi:hypothetical protein
MNGPNLPNIAAVVPIHNGREETLAFLDSLGRATYPNLEIIVADDGSTDGSVEAITKHFPDVSVVRGDGNLWWAGGVNLGVAEALKRSVEFILVINNDTVVEPGFLEPLVETALANPRSIVTSKIYDFDDRTFISSFGGKINWLLGEIRDVTSRRDRCDFNQLRECDWVNGSSTLIPAAAFMELGFFDQQVCPQYHGDAEFCLHARRRGYRLLAEPRSIVYRKTGVSAGNSSMDADSITNLLNGVRSPFYFRANHKVYREYCPYWPYPLFLAIRYARLAYSLLRRTFIDRTRPNVAGR